MEFKRKVQSFLPDTVMIAADNFKECCKELDSILTVSQKNLFMYICDKKKKGDLTDMATFTFSYQDTIEELYGTPSKKNLTQLCDDLCKLMTVFIKVRDNAMFSTILFITMSKSCFIVAPFSTVFMFENIKIKEE